MNEDLQKTATKVFEGKRFDVVTTELPNRDPASGMFRKDVVVHPGAVVILPLLNERTIVMIRNDRSAVGQLLWELPAGTLDSGEPPEQTAGRELIEEAGYRASGMNLLTTFFSSPGICTEQMWAYLATDLEAVGQQLEASEKITVEVMPLEQSIAMIRDGEIRDGKTIATLLYYQTFGNHTASR